MSGNRDFIDQHHSTIPCAVQRRANGLVTVTKRGKDEKKSK
jgi:hypothetical protein